MIQIQTASVILVERIGTLPIHPVSSDLRAFVPAVQALHSLYAVQAVHPSMAVLQSTNTDNIQL